jgi:hypothetical protein
MESPATFAWDKLFDERIEDLFKRLGRQHP